MIYAGHLTDLKKLYTQEFYFYYYVHQGGEEERVVDLGSQTLSFNPGSATCYLGDFG